MAASFRPHKTRSRCRAAGVVLTSVKRAEDASGVVFRLLETEGKAATAKVKINPQLLGKPGKAIEVDLLERPVAKSSARASKEGFTVSRAACDCQREGHFRLLMYRGHPAWGPQGHARACRRGLVCTARRKLLRAARDFHRSIHSGESQEIHSR